MQTKRQACAGGQSALHTIPGFLHVLALGTGVCPSRGDLLIHVRPICAGLAKDGESAQDCHHRKVMHQSSSGVLLVGWEGKVRV
jgi:hypothetical protein